MVRPKNTLLRTLITKEWNSEKYGMKVKAVLWSHQLSFSLVTLVPEASHWSDWSKKLRL